MSLLIAIVGGSIGAALGYMFRYREWLREKRLLVYTDFISTFSVVVSHGVIAAAREAPDEFARAVDDYQETGAQFNSLRAQVSLLATPNTEATALACVEFVTIDLWPKRGAKTDDERTKMQWKGLELEHAFTNAARHELGPKLFRRRRRPRS